MTQKSLSATLRRIERNGVVDRGVIGSRPAAVEDRITDLGKTMRKPIDAILREATSDLAQIDLVRGRFHVRA